jgi:DNA replication licensing factor MCM3
MQIDTTNNIDSSALHKEAMKIAAAEFMGKEAQKQSIRQMMGKQNTRFDINLDNLRQFNQDLARYVTKNPIEAINIFESQLDRIVQDHSDHQKGDNEKQALANANDKAFPTKVKKYYVNFEGHFGQNHITPRGLKANLVNQFVSVQGIVTRMAIVRPKIQTSVHYCEATKKGLIKNYTDDTNLADMAEDVTRPNEGNV